MRKLIKFNLNDEILVKLTPLGVATLRLRYVVLRMEPEKYIKTEFIKNHGWHHVFTTWDFMNIFGDDMIMGNDPVCEMNVLFRRNPLPYVPQKKKAGKS